MNSRIFISYSRKDLEVARRVAEDVRCATGEVPWVDILGIETGTQFEDVIVRAIDSCEILLFLLSENSLRSEWTKKEVLYARNRKKRIFPIIVDGTELSGWFLFEFGCIDCIDYRSSDLRQKLMRDLCGNLGHEESVSSMTKSEKSSRGRAGIPRRFLLFLLLGGLLFVVLVGACWLGLRGGKNIQGGALPSVGNVPGEVLQRFITTFRHQFVPGRRQDNGRKGRNRGKIHESGR